MLDALMDLEVAVYELLRLEGHGEPVYEELKNAEGFEVRVQCRLEEKHSRSYELRGVRVTGDAQMSWRERDDRRPHEGDFIVVPSGLAYKIVSKETQTEFGSGFAYSKAVLNRTKLPLKAPKVLGDDDGE